MTGDENDIRKEIKQFISYEFALPYVIKVKIIRLVINKEDKNSDFYRWKGGKKIKDGSKYMIQYMKAWKAQFKYHGFKVDLNDETPFECVPNALYKMYGNREAGRSKFIAGVADKGIEYVKSILDKSMNDIDDENKNIESIEHEDIEYNFNNHMDYIIELKTKLKKDFLTESEKEEILNTINEIKTYIHNIENDINVENSYISQNV